MHFVELTQIIGDIIRSLESKIKKQPELLKCMHKNKIKMKTVYSCSLSRFVLSTICRLAADIPFDDFAFNIPFNDFAFTRYDFPFHVT